MKSSLDCDLIVCCGWKLYVLCGQLIYCIHDWMAVICPPCPLAPIQMFQWPKSRGSTVPAQSGGTGLDRSVCFRSAGSKWLHRSIRTVCGNLKRPKRNSSLSEKKSMWSWNIRCLHRAQSAISCSSNIYAVVLRALDGEMPRINRVRWLLIDGMVSTVLD